MASSRARRVTVGLPVRNGENYLDQTLRSIRAQSFEDFELIVSDNASFDATEQICRDHAAADPRLRYVRNPTDLGAAPNYNRTFELSSSEYFKWAAHDDLLAPDYLARCVAVLDAEPDVVLCHSRTRVIDADGRGVDDFAVDMSEAASPRAGVRFRRLALSDLWSYEIFGVIRAQALRRTPLHGRYVASDRILRAQLGLLGRFHEIPEYLFWSRDHPARSIQAWPAHHMRVRWFDTAAAPGPVFPHWRLLGEYARAVRDAPLPARERLACVPSLGLWMAIHMNWAWMLVDLLLAAWPGAWRLVFRLRRQGSVPA